MFRSKIKAEFNIELPQEINAEEYYQLISHFHKIHTWFYEKTAPKDFDCWMFSHHVLTSLNNNKSDLLLAVKTMVNYIVQNELIDLLKFLISINHPALYFSEALHLAARDNKPRMIITLLAAGFDVNMSITQQRLNSNESHITPLHEAASHGSLEAVRCLLENGANPNAYTIDSVNHSPLLDLSFCKSQTPLHKAICAAYINKLNLDLIKALLEGGADANLPQGGDQATPLHLAIQILPYEFSRHPEGNGPLVDLVALLLAHGADPLIKTGAINEIKHAHARIANLKQREEIVYMLQEQVDRLHAPQQRSVNQLTPKPIFSSPFSFINEWKIALQNGEIKLPSSAPSFKS